MRHIQKGLKHLSSNRADRNLIIIFSGLSPPFSNREGPSYNLITMKFNILSLFLLLYLTASAEIFSQTLTQTIRGTIRDTDTRTPLAGATIQLLELQEGTYSDADGRFKLANVPVGRYTVQISFLGYDRKTLSNLQVNSGKEMVLEVELLESVMTADVVEIIANPRQNHSLNEASMVSTRMFTVDETKRYAGSYDDPLRMAAVFAGVSQGEDDAFNEIVIRGNSPRMLLWQIEGVEVPSPNHFTEEGTASGAVSILSSNMLSNSDFSTGAFAPEYGNALSGVFDVKLRNGNNEKREYAAQIGILGVDVAAEGPFKEGGNASYLANYRYSTLAILNEIGINIVGDEIPVYQDLSFKLNLPTSKAGTFSLYGIGGLSHSTSEDTEELPDGTEIVYGKDRFDANMGLLGLNHKLILGSKTVLNNSLTLSATENKYQYEEEVSENVYEVLEEENFVNIYAKANLGLSHKLNARHLFKAGVIFTYLDFDLLSQEWYDDVGLQTEVDEKGNSTVFQAFGSWRYRINEQLTLNSGLHVHQFALTNKTSIEPRLGLKWELNSRQYISAGFGIHSRREGLSYYLAREEQEDGSFIQHNRDMDFTKARHFVLGFDQMLSTNIHLRVEAYYQDLFDVPVQRMIPGFPPSGKISSINFQTNYYTGDLLNIGTGKNYGLELTLERYFSDNYYFLLTGSLFESKYTGSDGIEHNTRFNGNYISNVLAGKEFPLGKNKQDILRIGIRAVISGGVKYTPIDFEASRREGYTVRDWTRPYEESVPDYFRPDMSFAYILNRKKTTHFIKLDIQNIINRVNTRNYFYLGGADRVWPEETGQLLPVLSYKIQF